MGRAGRGTEVSRYDMAAGQSGFCLTNDTVTVIIVTEFVFIVNFVFNVNLVSIVKWI